MLRGPRKKIMMKMNDERIGMLGSHGLFGERTRTPPRRTLWNHENSNDGSCSHPDEPKIWNEFRCRILPAWRVAPVEPSVLSSRFCELSSDKIRLIFMNHHGTTSKTQNRKPNTTRTEHLSLWRRTLVYHSLPNTNAKRTTLWIVSGLPLDCNTFGNLHPSCPSRVVKSSEAARIGAGPSNRGRCKPSSNSNT